MAEKRQGRIEVLSTKVLGDGTLAVWATLDGRDGGNGREYDWELFYVVRRSSTGGEIVELAVRPAPVDTGQSFSPGTAPPGGIPMKLLRLSSRELTTVAAEFTGGMVAAMSTPESHDEVQRWARSFIAEPHPGRKGRPVLAYAQVARRYVELLAGPTPTAALADELGLSASQIRNVLYEARRKGLLTPAPGGRAGGELTQKAIDILEQEGR